eukprot:CAMPEP_0194201678 /NCGR_PEP_ID=MMETSP0156-20130528/1889_1 /TAXON_ID=33649 /ORGANISM="Thalassionema nitzschioides, Strain L26-B" /LENGTH=546 /DNA_ID=CAMNT_0038926945 /DNA_START=81 /DNA_END=1721 /DNA_ORIENTATION=-
MNKLAARLLAAFAVLPYRVEPFLPFRSFTQKIAHSSSPSRFFSVTAAQNSNEISEEEDVIHLDIDENYEGDVRTYEDFYNEFMDALEDIKKNRISSVKDIQSIFDDMFEAYIASDDPSLWPNTTIYNILLEAHAGCTADEGGSEAEHILNRMEDLTVDTIARPNKESYKHVMDAWANRKNPSKAELLMERLQNRCEKTADPELQPDTAVYNKLIVAWVKSDSLDKSQQAERILNYMIEQYKNGNSLLVPNQKSFIQVMRCYGYQDKTKEGLKKVRELFQSMKHLYQLNASPALQPDTPVYNELINNIAFNKGIDNPAKETEDVLYEMLEAANAGNEALQPDSETFRLVFNSHKGNPDPSIAYKVEKLVELQKNSDVVPTAGSFNAAIQAIAWTRAPDKASLCWKLLQRMNEQDLTPTLSSYNGLLNACAHSVEPSNPADIFGIAVKAFNQLRDDDKLAPNVKSYSNFLRACAQLLPDNAKRDSVVQNVFLKCAEEGHVGRSVIAELLDACSEEILVNLLGGDPKDGLKIPRKWSRNVKDEREILRK